MSLVLPGIENNAAVRKTPCRAFVSRTSDRCESSLEAKHLPDINSEELVLTLCFQQLTVKDLSPDLFTFLSRGWMEKVQSTRYSTA